MKNILLATVVLMIAASSSSSFANDTSKVKKVVISFSEDDAKSRLPASVDEQEVVDAQARHEAKAKSLDEAIVDLF